MSNLNFQNSSENREINLLGFLPKFLSEFRELKAIFNAENPELTELQEAVRAAREAGFIACCSDKQLAKFEKMLGIFAAENSDISERRQRVLIRWNEAPPYTVSALNLKLAAICGEGNFSVLRELDDYRITVFTSGLQGRQLDELNRMLSVICPANLIVKIENRKNEISSQTVYLCGFGIYSAVIRA